MKKETNNYMELLATIESALPKAMITHYEQFDDIYYGWDICPKPGVLIRLFIEHNNCMRIKILKYTVNPINDTCHSQTIKMYDGPIFPNDLMEPDYNFIKQLLKYWYEID